ncbi:MAG TPA: hypothetical protein VGB67_08760, partial [Fibrella sp.]
TDSITVNGPATVTGLATAGDLNVTNTGLNRANIGTGGLEVDGLLEVDGSTQLNSTLTVTGLSSLGQTQTNGGFTAISTFTAQNPGVFFTGLNTGAANDDILTITPGSLSNGQVRRTSVSTLAGTFATTLAGNGLTANTTTNKIDLGDTLTAPATIMAGSATNSLTLNANSTGIGGAGGVKITDLATKAPSASNELVSVDATTGNLTRVTKSLAVAVIPAAGGTISNNDEVVFVNSAGTTNVALPTLVQGKKLFITNRGTGDVTFSNGTVYDGADTIGTAVDPVVSNAKLIIIGVQNTPGMADGWHVVSGL